MARAWLLCIALLAACGFGDNHGNRAVPQMCGDHVLDPGEGCDDGNTSDGDGCSAACAIYCDTADVFCANNEICTEFSTPLVISGITLGFCE